MKTWTLLLVYCHVDNVVTVILPFLELLPYLGKGLEGVFHIFHGVGGRRDDPEDYHSLRYDRIYDYGAEDAVVLPEVNGHPRGLANASLDSHRGHTGLCRADVEAELAEPVLEGAGHVEELLPELVALGAADDLEPLEPAFHEGHRERLRVYLGTEVVPEVVYYDLRPGHEPSYAGHGLRVSPDVEVHLVHNPEMLGSAASVLALRSCRIHLR